MNRINLIDGRRMPWEWSEQQLDSDVPAAQRRLKQQIGFVDAEDAEERELNQRRTVAGAGAVSKQARRRRDGAHRDPRAAQGLPWLAQAAADRGGAASVNIAQQFSVKGIEGEFQGSWRNDGFRTRASGATTKT